MSTANTPVKLTTALREAKWWNEFISIKDDYSWETLAKRFNTHAHLLRRAAKEAGVEKKALPPGGLRGGKPEVAPAPVPVAKAPPAKVESVPMTDLGPEGRIGALADRIGALSDADVAKLANVSAADVRAYRLRNKLAAHKSDAVAEAPVAPAKRRGRPPKAKPEVVVPVAAPPAPPAPVAAPAEAGRRRGINPYGRKGHPLKKHTALFGAVSDAEIAKAADVTVDVVVEYRGKHRLPEYVAPAPKVAPKAAPKVEAPAPKVVEAPPAPKAAEVAPVKRPVGRPRKVVVEAAPAPAPAPVVAAPVVAAPVAAPVVEAPVVAPVAPAAPVAAPAPAAPPVVVEAKVEVHEIAYAWQVTAASSSTTATFSLTGASAEQAIVKAVAALGRRADGPWTVLGISRGIEALT